MSETLVTCPVCKIPNFTEAGLRSHRCKGPLAGAVATAEAKQSADTALASTWHALDGIKAALESTRERLIAAEEVFLAASLSDRLKIGLHCYQAHLAFATKDPGKRNSAGRNQHSKEASSRRDESFESWLAEEVTWLKKPTAYKYMTAFRGLGLDETADEDLVEVTLGDRRRIASAAGAPAPTLASLIAAATDRLAPPAEPPAPPHQLTFDDYVHTLKQLREDADLAIEQAKDMPAPLRKQLVARFYASLHALTGTHWQPSDEAHELGNIDPDTIAL